MMWCGFGCDGDVRKAEHWTCCWHQRYASCASEAPYPSMTQVHPDEGCCSMFQRKTRLGWRMAESTEGSHEPHDCEGRSPHILVTQRCAPAPWWQWGCVALGPASSTGKQKNCTWTRQTQCDTVERCFQSYPDVHSTTKGTILFDNAVNNLCLQKLSKDYTNITR